MSTLSNFALSARLDDCDRRRRRDSASKLAIAIRSLAISTGSPYNEDSGILRLLVDLREDISPRCEVDRREASPRSDVELLRSDIAR